MKLDAINFDVNNIKIIQGIALGFLLIILILDLLLFLPLVQNIGQEKIQRDKDAAAVKFFKEVIAKKDKLTKAKIIPAEEVEALLDKIQKVAERDHLDAQIGATLIKDKQGPLQDFYAKKVFSMEASGSFKDLGVFLTALRERPEAVLDVQSIELSSDKKDVSKIHAQLNISVLTTKNDEDQ